MIKRTAHLVDSEIFPEGLSGPVVCWSGTDIPEGAYSVHQWLDQSYESLRSEYLTWVYELGNISLGRNPLKAHCLLASNGPSLWGTSLINEKSPLKSPGIYEVLKLRAFEKNFPHLAALKLEYHGSDPRLAKLLQASCKHWEVEFNWSGKPNRGRKDKLYKRLPHWVQGPLFLMHRLLTRWAPLTLTHLWRAKPKPVPGATLVTYFPNCDVNKPEFYSNYWSELHGVLSKIPVNWVWFFAENPQISFRQAIQYRINAKRSGRHEYFLIEDFFGVKEYLRAIVKWVKFLPVAFLLKQLRKHFQFSDSAFNFYEVLRDDLYSSFSGKAAMENIYLHTLFRRMAKELPAKPWGMFLWEGQGWESTLVAAWKAASESKVFGYQHSTLRPLDIRAFADPRCYLPNEQVFRSYPDTLIINGEGSLALLTKTGFPVSRLSICEAVRYGYLLTTSVKQGGEKRTLLVITDYLTEETDLQLGLLKKAFLGGALEGIQQIWLKPHPFGTFSQASESVIRDLGIQKVSRPLVELLQETSIAYVSNSTSASLEAAWLEVPLIIVGTKKSLNLNPLYGRRDVHFVTKASELSSVLRKPEKVKLEQNYFLLNPSLKAWTEMLT